MYCIVRGMEYVSHYIAVVEAVYTQIHLSIDEYCNIIMIG